MSVPLSWLLWDALALDFTHTDANCTFTSGHNSNEQFMHVRRCSHKHPYKSCMITHTVAQLYTRALAIITRARTHTHTHTQDTGIITCGHIHTPTPLHRGTADQLHDLLSNNVNVTTWGRLEGGGGGGLDGVIGVKKDRFKERAHDKLVLPIIWGPLSSSMQGLASSHSAHIHLIHAGMHTHATLEYTPGTSPWVVTEHLSCVNPPLRACVQEACASPADRILLRQMSHSQKGFTPPWRK